ncbi:hypothetical protein [Fundidesulfovibrio terrae]|uniref:hypothetical protein n=1 Tax=Fundidesulfovibrio terrae TaxID=2922866 RepID=UPI001FAEFD6B|nr:hypothetical protein [Fundidesulfovibrio terrae]
MNFSQARKAQTAFGWIAAALLLASLACLADGLAAGFKDQGRSFQAVPGDQVPVTAVLPPGASTLAEMRVLGGDASVVLVPEELYTGFWLGGTMWRGSISVDVSAAPGSRTFTLEGPPLPPGTREIPPQTYTVTVYADPLAMRRASPSFLTRFTGLNPFTSSLCLFLLALPAGAAGFLASRRMEQLLTLEGKGVVYRTKETEDGLVIAFSLGSRQGLAPGMAVRILDSAGRATGEASVTASMPEDATARLLSGSCDVGDMVVLSSGATAQDEAAAKP